MTDNSTRDKAIEALYKAGYGHTVNSTWDEEKIAIGNSQRANIVDILIAAGFIPEPENETTDEEMVYVGSPDGSGGAEIPASELAEQMAWNEHVRTLDERPSVSPREHFHAGFISSLPVAVPENTEATDADFEALGKYLYDTGMSSPQFYKRNARKLMDNFKITRRSGVSS